MTRPRSRAPGHPDPVYRRSRLPLLILFAMAASACIGGNSPATTDSPSVAPASAATSPSAASPAPSGSPTLAPTATTAPIETPIAEPSPSAPASDGVASVDGCTGTEDNRAFLAKAAAAFDWPVYCAALPARWFLAGGSYSGGKLDISYKGPNAAVFELHEGAFCPDGSGCVPEGGDAGTTAFGDRTATLVHFEDGRVAAVVDRGERLSWLAIGEGLSDEVFQSIAAALIRLD